MDSKKNWEKKKNQWLVVCHVNDFFQNFLILKWYGLFAYLSLGNYFQLSLAFSQCSSKSASVTIQMTQPIFYPVLISSRER